MSKIKTKSGDYEVGYGKPPQHTRFAPGQSGNRKGRPKKQMELRTAFLNELNDPVVVTESNRRKTITKQEVMIKQLVNKAASGDLGSIKLVHELLQHWDHPSRRPIYLLITKDDLEA